MIIATVLAALVGAALYRLRGGGFSAMSRAVGWQWGGQQRTQTMRLLWSLPTSLLWAFALNLSWLVTLELVVSTFAGLALLGHGAHMVFDSKYFVEHSKNKTELLTGFWLPHLFGGIPDSTWNHNRVAAYNIIGMSSIGLARCLITVTPLLVAGETIPAAIYAASGLLHGPLYWAGWRINGSSATSECLVGAVSWALIINL